MTADISHAFPEYHTQVLDDLLIDPVVRDFLHDVALFHGTDEGMSYIEASKKVQELDECWRSKYTLLSKQAVITGNGLYCFSETEHDGAELVPRRIEDALVRSEGFTLLPVENSEDNLKYKIVMLFTELLPNEDEQDGECRLAFDIKNIEALKFDERMSCAQAEAILNYYAPHIRSELDCALFAQDKPVDEISAVFDLANKIWDTSSYQEDQAYVRRAINVYIESHITFDELPYVINGLECKVYQVASNRSLKIVNLTVGSAAPAIVNRLVFSSPYSEENDTEDLITAHLDCTIYGSERKSPGIQVIVPMHTVHSLVSSRDIVGDERVNDRAAQ